MKSKFAILLLLNHIKADYRYLQINSEDGLYVNEGGYEYVAIGEDQGVYVNKKMGSDDMNKTDFEMIFDGEQH